MASYIRKKRRSLARSASAELIACSDDLLMQILLCLPAKTVLRLRIVNKHWHSLISSPEFRLIHCRHNFKSSPSGLFLRHSASYNLSKSIVFDTDGHPMPRSSSIFPQKHGRSICRSCNGLFLCCYDGNFYVVNPTTKQSALLPRPEGITQRFFGMSLAFDPFLSPQYKVVYFWRPKISRELYSQVYSSKTCRWEPSNPVAFPSSYAGDYCVDGLYCNGALHWMLRRNCLVYYKVNEDHLYTMELPSRHAETERRTVKDTVFAAIKNNLIFVDHIYENTYKLIVFELDKDYSGFLRKYHVGVDVVLSPFPHLKPSRSHLLCAFQGLDKEDIVVIMESDGKTVIAHHTKDNSTEILHELREAKTRRCLMKYYVAHDYIESLCPVLNV